MSVRKKVLGTALLATLTSTVGLMVYSWAEPSSITTPAPRSYTNEALSIRLKPARLPSNIGYSPLVTGAFYAPSGLGAPVDDYFICRGSFHAEQPVPWRNFHASELVTGKRVSTQFGNDFLFLDLVGGKPTGIFQPPGFCDVTIGHLADRRDRPQNDNDIVAPVRVFRGDIPSESKLSLFDGDIQVWTTSWSTGPQQCDLLVRFNGSASRHPDFQDNRQPDVPVFYLTRNGRDVYKFDTRQSAGKPFFGSCPVEISHIKLPPIPDAPAKVYRNEAAPAAGDVSGYQAAQNVMVQFNNQTRVETREENVSLRINPHTRYYLSRSFTTSNEISFGDTRSWGTDISSPLVGLLTGGLLNAEIKTSWEGRFNRGMGQAATITAQVELDGNFCTDWEYSVYATVRDGVVSAKDYGVDKPVAFSITENVHIDAKPRCAAPRVM